MMTPEHRYLFDTNGYVYVKTKLNPEEEIAWQDDLKVR